MLGSLILYLKGMRRMMFQLSGFYYKLNHHKYAYHDYLTFLTRANRRSAAKAVAEARTDRTSRSCPSTGPWSPYLGVSEN